MTGLCSLKRPSSRQLSKISNHTTTLFDTVHPGVVKVQKGADKMSKKLNLLTDPTWRPLSHDLPPIITPAGLSDERVAYLHDKIREFCREEVQDLVCPAPMGLSHSHHCQPHIQNQPSQSNLLLPKNRDYAQDSRSPGIIREPALNSHR